MSKVSFSFDKGKSGVPVCVVEGGEYNKDYVYLHDESFAPSKKRGVQEFGMGKHKLMKMPPRKEAEVMRYLQDAFRKGIPVEHLNCDVPGAEDVYLQMFEDSSKPQTSIKLPPGSHFKLIPSTNPEKREIWYIAGASGSGKSYVAKQLSEMYHKYFPDRSIYLVSKLQEDETLDNAKCPMTRLNTAKLIENPMKDLEPLRDSMIIFDDYDTFTGAEAKIIQQLIDDIAVMGRHQNITMLCLTHYLTNFKKTRLMLTEATHFVLYPQSTGAHALEYLLKTHLGLDRKEVANMKRTGSRFLCIHKNFPQYYISETECALMNQGEPEAE